MKGLNTMISIARYCLRLVACCLIALFYGGCFESSFECADKENRPAVPAWEPADLVPLHDPQTNPFAQPIEANPALHEDSTAAVEGLRRQFDDQGMGLAVTEWTTPVYLADADTPRRDVALTAPWAPYETLLQAPIPEWAIPDPEDDGHVTVIDTDAGIEYDFWQFCAAEDEVTSSWANLLDLPGDGVFPRGLSARGSGFALTNGVIWPHELEAGRIEHALLFSYDLTMAGGPVEPASQSDGTGSGGDHLPEGARVQLDPSLDVTAMGLEPWQETVALALQEFGMILGDDGGGISLYALHPFSFPDGEAVYDGLLDISSPFLLFPSSFPVESFRVLDWGPQDSDFESDSDVSHPDRFE